MACKNPSRRSNIFDNMCSFEVRGCCLSLWLSYQKNPFQWWLVKIYQNEVKICSVVARVLPLSWSSHQKNPCYRSLMKIHQHEAEIFNKTCNFEVSIGLFPLSWLVKSSKSIKRIPDCLIKRIPIEVFMKIYHQWSWDKLTKYAVLKLA